MLTARPVVRHRRLPFWVSLAVVSALLLTPGTDVPVEPPASDKVVHALLFAVLALTGRVGRFPLLPLGIGLFAYAVATETLQGLLPIDRYGDPLDVLADSVGMLIGLVVGWSSSLRFWPGSDGRADQKLRDDASQRPDQ